MTRTEHQKVWGSLAETAKLQEEQAQEAVPRSQDTLRENDVLAQESWSGLLEATLAAITSGNDDEEMNCRLDLKTSFRLTDDKITSDLFRAFTKSKVKKVQQKHDSVDLREVEQLTYLKDGWLPKGDVALWFSPFGVGKTTTALAAMWAIVTATPFLDRDDPGKPLKVLFIATDSGVAPLKKSLDDLQIDSNHPYLTPGHPEQRIWVWGNASDQGHESWRADIRGVIRLEQFIRKNNIDAVFIDSVKSVSSTAGWSHENNLASRAMLTYLREGICQPTGCSILALNHDGTKEGTSSGAKSWAEEPSIVVAFSKALDTDGRQIGVTAKFKKDRAAVIDPFRSLTFNLNRETGVLQLAPEVEVVGNCREAIIDVLWRAHKNGTPSMTRKSLVDAVFERHGKPTKTVDNTLGSMYGERKLTKPHRGSYALAPKLIQQKEASYTGFYIEGSNKEETQSETAIKQVPEAVPTAEIGNTVVPEGNMPGSRQTPVTPVVLAELLPSPTPLPYEMEDSAYNF